MHHVLTAIAIVVGGALVVALGIAIAPVIISIIGFLIGIAVVAVGIWLLFLGVIFLISGRSGKVLIPAEIEKEKLRLAKWAETKRTILVYSLTAVTTAALWGALMIFFPMV